MESTSEGATMRPTLSLSDSATTFRMRVAVVFRHRTSFLECSCWPVVCEYCRASPGVLESMQLSDDVILLIDLI